MKCSNTRQNDCNAQQTMINSTGKIVIGTAIVLGITSLGYYLWLGYSNSHKCNNTNLGNSSKGYDRSYVDNDEENK